MIYLLSAMLAEADQPIFPEDLKSVDKIIWLTPINEKPNQFVATEIALDSKSKLVDIFQKAKRITGIIPYYLDTDRNDQGFLIFKFKNQDFAIRVFGAVNKKKSANICKIRKFKDNEFDIVETSLESGIETEVDYREILKKIAVSKDPKSTEIYKSVIAEK